MVACIRRMGRSMPLVHALAIAWVAAATACTDGRRDAPAGPAATPAPSSLRVVSLSPALTHSAIALGAAGSIVGRTPWCTAPDAVVVGSLTDRNLEAIAALRPTLVLRQSGVPDAALEELCTALGARLYERHLNSLDDVRNMVRSLGEALEGAGCPGASGAASAALERHTAELQHRAAAGPTLFLFSTDPPSAFGAGTFVDGLWSAMGGTNAIRAEGYPVLSAEDVVRLRPARILLLGASAAPAWLHASGAACPVPVATALLEPSVAMLVDGPAILRAACDDRASGAPAVPEGAAP